MPRYFFDIWDGDNFAFDEEGMELADEDAAEREAQRSLIDLVKQRDSEKLAARWLAVEVRDADNLLFELSINSVVTLTRH